MLSWASDHFSVVITARSALQWMINPGSDQWSQRDAENKQFPQCVRPTIHVQFKGHINLAVQNSSLPKINSSYN